MHVGEKQVCSTCRGVVLEAAGNALIGIMSNFATKYVLAMLFVQATTGGSAGKWETQVGALDLIAVVCGKAPEQVSQVLAETVTCTSHYIYYVYNLELQATYIYIYNTYTYTVL